MAYAYLIPVFPLLAAVINIFWGAKLKHKSAWVAVAGCLLSAALSYAVGYQVIKGAHYHHTFQWLSIGQTVLTFGILIDPLTAMMLFVVTTVAACVFIYSIGYMHDDARYSRFFAYISLFLFSMLGLVLANHFVMLYIFWELVGLCSYLLISFWFEKDSAANAGKKAFITTRVGDIGLFIGIVLLWLVTGQLEFANINPALAAQYGGMNGTILTIACILIFAGACGKSAQFPLHVWLPDAMEGPTSVSALIHAATMVAAGVYLVARTLPFIAAFESAMSVITCIGMITALLAAFIALTATDIKKVLAYSTISQLGYMMTALGLGGLSAGTFHLMTHAFFKALLFLGAGSVIHGTHTQDLRQMGGLFGKMKITALTFLIGALAIAGVPPLAGFFSKDEILLAAFAKNQFVFALLLLVSFMTAFYMFRMYILAFWGKSRDHHVHEHAHESPAVMTLPLCFLAVFAVFLGLCGSPMSHQWFQHFLDHHYHHASHHAHQVVAIASVIAAGSGITLALIFYLFVPVLPEFFGKLFRPLYLLSLNKFWLDELYEIILIKPFYAVSNFLFRFDQKVVDGAVNQTGLYNLRWGMISDWIDRNIVDGAVNGAGTVTRAYSEILRQIQTGGVQNYILALVLGILFSLIVVIF